MGEHQQVINNGGQITPASSVPPSLAFGEVQQAQDGDSETPPPDPGRLVVRETGMRYIDGAHWSAILEEVRSSFLICGVSWVRLMSCRLVESRSI